MKIKILIVEDDDNLRNGLILSLESETITPFGAATIAEAQQRLGENSFKLILLDYKLPDGNDIDFCRKLRAVTEIPIIFLTVNDTEIEIVSAFKVGATDYVTKPFSVMILRERIHAALKWSIQNREIYKEDPYFFDFSNFDYQVDGIPIVLSTLEQKILHLLIANRNRIVPRERMIEAIWSCDGAFIDDNALTVSVKRLRAKIGVKAIKTIYGLGYLWTGGDAE